MNSTHPVSGWFVAPATADYRFYVSCGSACELYLDYENPFVPGSPSTEEPQGTLIASLSKGSRWREYFYNLIDGTHFSEWISLVEGESYYMVGETSTEMAVAVEVKNYESVEESRRLAGLSTVEVEEEPEEIIHPQLSKTVFQIAMEQTNTPEEWSLTVGSPDSGTYKLNFVNSKTTPMSYYTTSHISASASASQFASAINGFYRSVHGGHVEVTRVMYDMDSLETEDEAIATSYQYNVKVMIQVNGVSSISVTSTPMAETNKDGSIKNNKTTSSISIVPPSQGVQGSAPINGTYALQCYSPLSGTYYTSEDIQYDTGAHNTWYALQRSMAMMADTMEVLDDYRYDYKENGVSYMIHFYGLAVDIDNCQMIPG